MDDVPQWLIDMPASNVGKLICEDGRVCTAGSRGVGIVRDRTVEIWPQYKLESAGVHPVSVVNPVAPDADIAVAAGDFLVNHDGSLRVASAEESLTMDVIARSHETYSGPPKLIKASIWL